MLYRTQPLRPGVWVGDHAPRKHSGKNFSLSFTVQNNAEQFNIYN